MKAMRTLWIILPLLATGCGSTPGAGGDGGPSTLKNSNEVPRQVRAIETVIDAGGCIKAEEIAIYVSRNYEWDVALTGDLVSAQKSAGGGEHVSVATGHARAMFRNLDIRAYDKITFRKSGFDVVPFIRIRARGNAIFIQAQEGAPDYKVTQADEIIVKNADVRFVGRKGVFRAPRPGDRPAAGDAAPARGVRRDRQPSTASTTGSGR